MKRSEFVHIGSLQDPGKPYADLYTDKLRDKLYVLLRLSSPNEVPGRYAILWVTPKQVEEYMTSDMPIADVFADTPYCYADVANQQVSLKDPNCLMKTTKDTFLYNTPFDADLCDDEVELELFLNSFSSKK